MHLSAPSHPLIHAFLLQREEFQHARKLIVETREQGEKLLKVLQALGKMTNDEGRMTNDSNSKQKHRLITTKTDILEWTYDTSMIGIFPIETLDWSIEGLEKTHMLTLEKGMKLSEELLISWLSDHGFKARKSDEEHTFYRQGDTVTIQTKNGPLLVNFFGTKLETLYLDGEELDAWKFFSVL